MPFIAMIHAITMTLESKAIDKLAAQADKLPELIDAAWWGGAWAGALTAAVALIVSYLFVSHKKS